MYKKNRENIHVPQHLFSQHSSVRSTPAIPQNTSQESPGSPEEWDIMISYCHADKEFMAKLKGKLQENNFSVWVDTQDLDAGDNFLSEIGKAIINSKIILPIISKSQIKSRYCRDEIAFAYISDKPMIPVGLFTFDEVKSDMPTGMRLQLASLDWIHFDRCTDSEGSMLLGEDEEFDLEYLNLKEMILEILEDSAEDAKKEDPIESARRRKEEMSLKRMKSQHSKDVEEEDFWDKHFINELQVKWSIFIDHLQRDFGVELSTMYNEKDLKWLIKNLEREMNVSSDGILQRTDYISFQNVSFRSIPFFERINKYAIEIFAVREVFSIESSVRVDAIENLGKYKSQAVIEALLDLLSDDDVDVRTVTLISIARTGNNSDNIVKRICKCLDDPDRLVRESACLALSRLRCSGKAEEYVVPKILNLWRNDVISSVRDSAELALKQLDSEKARLAIKMTTILQSEIKLLKE